MCARASSGPFAMEPLPFPDMPDTGRNAVDVGARSDISCYTAPTWVRSTPRRRPSRVDWPPRTPVLAADEFFTDLVAQISVDERISRRVHAWADRARLRIAESVRPHLGDVDAVVSGSFAAGTHIATAPWDVNVVVRAHRGRPEWGASPAAALDDMARWLRAAIDANVVTRPQSVVIESPGGLGVDVVIWWRPSEESIRVSPSRSKADQEQVPFDPLSHRDLIAARDASLGNDSAFVKLIRVVKHLNERWRGQHGEAPLESFHVEVLALTACTRPFTLPEGVSGFFRQAAQLVRGPTRHPAAPACLVTAVDPPVASELLADAAERCEQALFAADASTAAGVLGRLFGL